MKAQVERVQRKNIKEDRVAIWPQYGCNNIKKFPYFVDISLEHSNRVKSYIVNEFEDKTGIKLRV